MKRPDGRAPEAVVVGLCAHGLALARALGRAGRRVLALEARPDLPGTRTRLAEVHQVDDINGDGLIEALDALSEPWPAASAPVLFLTNDNMVRTLARQWERLEGRYRLSWSHCREDVLALLDKRTLEAHCRRLGLAYPETRLLQHAADLEPLIRAGLPLPLIVKPAHPLSGFKVRLVRDHDALRALVAEHPRALPLLLQQWIEGDDRQLRFTAFYLDEGRIVARFEGRKLASRPAALGQTTIAEAHADAEALRIAERFFAPLGLSGPVSLEIKRDPQGRPWIIEPTIGRTDYWLDCCLCNGLDLPGIEYAQQVGLPLPPATQHAARCIWFDTERQPLAWLGHTLKPQPTPWRPRFAYWDRDDPRPFWHALRRTLWQTATRIGRRLRHSLRR